MPSSNNTLEGLTTANNGSLSPAGSHAHFSARSPSAGQPPLPQEAHQSPANHTHHPIQTSVDDMDDIIFTTYSKSTPSPVSAPHPDTLILPYPEDLPPCDNSDALSSDDIPTVDAIPEVETTVEFDYLVQRLEQELQNVVIHRNDLQLSRQYIDALKSATLEESAMKAADIKRLRGPTWAQSIDLKSDEGLRISLETFVDTLTASDETYEKVINRYQTRRPNIDFLSRYRIEKHFGEISPI